MQSCHSCTRHSVLTCSIILPSMLKIFLMVAELCSRNELLTPARRHSSFPKQKSGYKKPGPSCSKLTTSLVNVSLKFQTLISGIRHYFLLKKCEKLLQCKSFSHFFNKNISVFGYKVVKHLTS